MVRTLLITMAVCAFLAYIGWLQWESLIMAMSQGPFGPNSSILIPF